MLHVTDVVVVGLVSVHEATALSASRAITFVGIVASLSPLSGVLVFASRTDGAGDGPRTGAVLREGLSFGIVLRVMMAALLIAALTTLRRGGTRAARLACGAAA